MKTFLLFLVAVVLSGCLSRKPVNKETFAFSIPKPAHVSISASAQALTLRRITVAAPFDSSSLTYRTGEFSYERDPYASFLVSPAESLNGPVRALLENAGKFSPITDADSSLRANLDLEISVTQLYGDFRNTSQPTAVLEMHFILFQTKERSSSFNKTNVVFENTYSRCTPLKARTAVAVVQGLNEALGQIVNQFATEVPAL